ncbi:MAG: hypothetical protein QOE55_127 [Acidobacteriaceae bacterium]|nr:hypothetical protein [Acidobacteriaceae bacterium]
MRFASQWPPQISSLSTVLIHAKVEHRAQLHPCTPRVRQWHHEDDSTEGPGGSKTLYTY